MKRFRLHNAEWIVSLLLTMVVAALLVVRACHAGGLWRDECGCVQLARLPSWSDVQARFQFEAFPLLFPAIIRTLTSICGTSDFVFRVYGLVVGLLLLGAIWWHAWVMSRRPPLLSLSLIGLCPTVLLWSTTIRGYGPACVAIIVASACLFRVRSCRDWGWISVALVAAVISVQLALHNVVILSVLCGVLCAVRLSRREFQGAGVVACIGLVSCCSLLPDLPGYRSADWNILVREPVTVPGLTTKLLNACGGGIPGLKWVWAGLFFATLGAGSWRLLKLRRSDESETSTAIPLESGVSEQSEDRVSARSLRGVGEWSRLIAVLAGIVCLPVIYLLFLKYLSYPTQAWYYVILIVMLGCLMEAVSAQFSNDWMRDCRICLAMGLVVWLLPPVSAQVRMQQTNLDVIADTLEQRTNRRDLILVTPWYFGVSFRWYYQGAASWSTVPELADVTVHRYDLFQQRMASSRPLDSIFQRIRSTLRDGGRVWMVGQVLPVPADGPHLLPPAPLPGNHWPNEAYRVAWTEQVVDGLRRHGRRFQQVEIPRERPTFETADVWEITGWR